MGASEKQALLSTTLGCVADFQNGGAWKESEYVDSGVPVTRVTNCQSGTVDLSGCKYLSFSSAKKYERHRLIKGDLIVATVGSHPTQPGSVVGRTSTVPESASGSLLNQNAVRLRAKADLLDQRYLTYLASSKEFRDYIIAHARGAASQVRMSIELLRDMPLLLPPLSIQQLVASFLSAYDDLIDNNMRRIELLEEMARRLYEEWFVQFRFPGHEGSEFKESELGLIPEGWRLTTVAETFETMGGGTPSKSESAYWEGGKINWYSPTDLTRSGTSFMDESATKITDIGLSRSSARLFPAYSVMLTSRATIGAVSINTTPATTNQGFITCIPNERFPLYLLFHWLKDNVDRFISLGTGATFKEITKSVFKEIELVAPPAVIVDAFQQTAAPLMELVLRLQRKNRNLRAQRDLLLPKLLSGEIDVSDIPMPT